MTSLPEHRPSTPATPFLIRPCRGDEQATILAIVNAAAQAYRGVIPEDRWHDPYMGGDELTREIAAGVTFSACEADGEVVGVMGIQPVRNVELVRHAYVRPDWQGRGVGQALMERLRQGTSRQVLVGTWATASWAIRFYERNGFTVVRFGDESNNEEGQPDVQYRWGPADLP